jgi:rod shape-determining protein MreB
MSTTKSHQNEQSKEQNAVTTADGSKNDKESGVLYLGIDLGTSRTSVSSSNGVRDTVSSFVGYPKDPVSRKLLKRDILFGQDAVENRLALNFYRPVEQLKLKETQGDVYSNNLKAAQDLITEIIRRARPRKDELIYSVIGVPAQASIHNKQAILDAAREVVDSVMLCSEPFTVAYGRTCSTTYWSSTSAPARRTSAVCTARCPRTLTRSRSTTRVTGSTTASRTRSSRSTRKRSSPS